MGCPRDVFPAAKRFLTEALREDDELAEAHAGLGRVLAMYEYDWAGAERAFERALQLDPAPGIRGAFALHLLRPMRRWEEADEQLRLALELDPLSPLLLSIRAAVSSEWGRAELARALAHKALDLDPDYFWAHLILGYTGWPGDEENAVVSLERAAANSGRLPMVLGTLAACYAALGRAGDASRVWDELEARRSREWTSPSSFAAACLGRGETAEVFRWLHLAATERDPHVVTVRAYLSRFGLEGHAGYAELMRLMKLE